MIFGLLTSTAEDALDLITDPTKIDKAMLARLIDAGLTIWAISEATGIAVDVLQAMLDE